MINCEQWRVSFQNPHLKGHFGWYKPSKLLPWLLVTIKDLKLSLFPLFLLFFFLNYAKKKKHTHTRTHTFAIILLNREWHHFSKECQRHGKTGGLGRVQVKSIGLWVKMGHFKRIKNGFGSIGLQVRSGWVNSYFLHKIFFYKENNLYLPFGKLYNKLLDVKCTTLNSPLISRMYYTY